MSAVASVDAGGVVEFVVKTHSDGEQVRRATAVLQDAEDAADSRPPTTCPRCWPPTRCRWTARRCGSWFDAAGYPVRSRVHRPCGGAHHRGHRSAPCWPKSRCRARSARSRAPTRCIPRCWTPASSRSVRTPICTPTRGGALMLPLGVRALRAHASTRNAHYCYMRLTSASAAAVEADLDVLDEHGRGPADRDGPASRHRCVRGGTARPHAERATAHHRLAPAGAARGRRRRAGLVAGGQHLGRLRHARGASWPKR